MKKVLKILLFHIAVIDALCGYALLVGCPVYRITGFSCPFCGMTRAHLALLRGDLQAALEYHSLFYLGIPFVTGLAHLRILKKYRRLYVGVSVFLIAALLAFFVRYLLIIFF